MEWNSGFDGSTRRPSASRRERIGWQVAIALIALVALVAKSSNSRAAPSSLASAQSAIVWSYSLATGDLDADGNLDLVMTSAFDSTVSALLGAGDGTFLPRVTFATGGYPVSVAIADLDGDGKPDLAVANLGSHTVSVLPGNGDGTFEARTDFAAGSGPHSVAIGDLDGDGVPDLAVANANSRSVSALAGAGDGTFGQRREFAAGSDPSSVVIADFNGDGLPDLAVANWGFAASYWSLEDRDYVSTISILMGDGNGTFGPKTDVTTGGFPLSIGWGDLNGDAIPDLLTSGQSRKALSVLLGRGDGTFEAKSRFATCGSGGSSLATADLNGDGKLDVVVTDPSSGRFSILLGYGDGTFAPGACFPTLGRPIAAVIGDYNSDGRPDIATAQIDPDTISVLLSEDLRLPPAPLPKTSYSLGLWPNPTRGATDIHWVVPHLEYAVDVDLFDLAGRRVRRLFSDPGAPPGAGSVHWDGRDDRGARVRAGIYLVRLRVGADIRVARLVVMP